MEDFEKGLHIPELYDLNHFNDNELHQCYNYQDNILKNGLSDQILKNDKTNGFLSNLQQMVVCMIQSNLILRNWFSSSVPKYYDRHPN
jgi:hypothetical protein